MAIERLKIMHTIVIHFHHYPHMTFPSSPGSKTFIFTKWTSKKHKAPLNNAVLRETIMPSTGPLQENLPLTFLLSLPQKNKFYHPQQTYSNALSVPMYYNYPVVRNKLQA